MTSISFEYYDDDTTESGTQECSNCGYPAPLYPFDFGLTGLAPTYFCEICASTHLATATKQPDQCPDPQLYKSIGWIANHIMNYLSSLRNGASSDRSSGVPDAAD